MPRFASPYEQVCAHLARSGLNVAGVADAAAYDSAARPELASQRLLPGARRVLVLASGGSSLWRAMVAELRASPELLAQTAHPVDAYVARRVAEVDASLADVDHRWFFASATADLHLDFRTLALTAGLGSHSRLGLLLHPEHGPWLGLRAACFVVDDRLQPAAPLTRSLCDGCPAPCVAACPGSAFPDSQWDVGRCSTFHRVSQTCARSCDARTACPVGAASRYPDDELAYHYDRRTGREALRLAVGLGSADDPHEGVGPHWDAW